MTLKSILLVEDELTILRVNKAYFEKSNFIVYTATNGQEALNIFKKEEIDLICLDIMMPLMNGWDFAKEIRKISSIPIIVVTALEAEEDMLKGYDLKIDDYITKPFSPKVLVAKVTNLLERLGNQENVKTMLYYGALTIDTTSRKIYVENQEVVVSKTEFDLLVFLSKNSGKVCSREDLLDAIWGYDVFVEDRIIDTYIKNLRKLLGNHKYIKTIFKIGYRFEVTEVENLS